MPAEARPRILVLRTDRLGDVILSIPVAVALKKRFAGAHITFLVREYTRAVCEMCPEIDEVVTLESIAAAAGPKRLRHLLVFLRRQRFDVALHLFPRPLLALATFLARIPERIGSGYRGYSLLFNRRHYEHRKSAAFHEAEYNLHLLQHLGIESARVEFSLQIPETAQQRAADLLAECGVSAGEAYVVLHPGSGGSARDWPLPRFRALAQQLGRRFAVPVVVTGSPSEQQMAGQLTGAAEVKLFSLAGRLNIHELAAVLQRARVVVANSTGPLHLAVAGGSAVVAFYPPIRPCRPERWGPYGQRANVLMSQDEECRRCRLLDGGACACMAAIPVEAALVKISALLQAGSQKEFIHESRMLR